MKKVVVFALFLLVILSVGSLFLQPVSFAQQEGVGGTPGPAFLPVVVRPFPTTTPVYLANGNFENGRSGWDESSSNGYVLILRAGQLPPPISPRSGIWAAYLAGAHNEVSIIQQTVTIPPQAAYLHYWYWNDSIEQPCGFHDVGRVVINSTTVDQIDLCGNTGDWLERVVNLSAYAGQTVSLQIRAETNGSLYSNLFIDDVSLQGG